MSIFLHFILYSISYEIKDLCVIENSAFLATGEKRRSTLHDCDELNRTPTVCHEGCRFRIDCTSDDSWGTLVRWPPPQYSKQSLPTPSFRAYPRRRGGRTLAENYMSRYGKWRALCSPVKYEFGEKQDNTTWKF